MSSGSGPAVRQAIILAGGLGTRLRSVCPDLPKPLVPVLGRPFLDYIIEYLAAQGVADVILSTGYGADKIEAHYSSHGESVRCVKEPAPMGTGGAVAYVLSQIPRDGFLLIANGDSLAPFRLADLISSVRKGGDGAIVGVRTGDCRRFGSLSVTPEGWLGAFLEKSTLDGSGIVNAGIYLLHSSLIPDREESARPASIEKHYFPRWLATGRRIGVVVSDGPFIDIGTPESLAAAGDFMHRSGIFEGLTRPK